MVFSPLPIDQLRDVILEFMRKFGLFLVIPFVLVVAGLAAAGFRLQRGGSGWPRFVARSHDAVLEADRAQQREMSPPSHVVGRPGWCIRRTYRTRSHLENVAHLKHKTKTTHRTQRIRLRST